jgi:hypothetical protein
MLVEKGRNSLARCLIYIEDLVEQLESRIKVLPDIVERILPVLAYEHDRVDSKLGPPSVSASRIVG